MSASPLDRFRRSTAAVADELGPLLARAVDLPTPEAGAWGVPEVLAHLVHAELVYGVRVATIVTADHPPIPAYDQDAWATRFAATDGDPVGWLELWSALRARNLLVLAGLTADEWHRAGRHAERGDETVADVVAHLAHHDLEHLAQLRSLLDPGMVAGRAG